MDFEIEFHPVGDASKAGDATVVRYGFNGQYQVVVIDGGTEDSGAKLVEHIKSVYGPNTVIEHAICTHPDTDHASGLRHGRRAPRQSSEGHKKLLSKILNMRLCAQHAGTQ